MILSSIKTGISLTWQNKRMVLIYYLANLFFGIILMLPFRSILNKFIDNSMMGEKLAGRLDMDFFFEFLKNSPNIAPTYLGLLLIVPAIYWLFNLFLSGGALSVFISEERYSSSLFWNSAVKYFGRFIRLVLWSIPVFIILFGATYIWNGIERLVFGKDPYQYITYWSGWFQMGLRYIALIIYLMILDYARIHAVTNNELRMRISLWQGIKFVFKNFGKTFGIALLLFLAGIIGLIIYNPIADLFSAPYSIVILVLFLWQQVYVVFRMVVRLSLYGGEVGLNELLKQI